MITRRILCVAPAGACLASEARDAMREWEVCTVNSLAEAASVLRGGDFFAGLLVGVIGVLRAAEVDQFLRAHSQVQWIGLLGARTLASQSCRDLVADHLYDYHTLPVDGQRLATMLGHLLGLAALRRPHTPSAPGVAGTTRQIGNSEAIVRLRAHIARVARVPAPVLLWGESGTGKELAALALHEQSARAHAPFIAINCGAIAPNLIQSELFGHEKGAFTGATRDKAGLLEAAAGGTVFLDEIGDLPRELQANLLRFLQEKTVCRLGATRTIAVDVRVIAASHVCLEDAVARGDFRADLYYRLAVLPITVPSLRERRDDLMMLADHFFSLYAAEKNPRLKGFASSAVRAILDHDWPGNVRELMNRVRRAMVMAEGHLIGARDLGFDDRAGTAPVPELDATRSHTERRAIFDSLARTGHNVSRAARDLGVSRTTMYRLLSKHGIRA